MVSLISSPKKEDAIDFLKNKTVYPRRIFRWSRVTGKLFGNDGTRIDQKIKEKKLESPMI
jgi:hypothetical protein